MATVLEELQMIVEQLSPDNQRRVLELAQALAQTHSFPVPLPITKLPPGTPGSALLDFSLPQEVIEAMEEALKDCERIDPDEHLL
jgi:hypothetical protein